MLAPLDNEVVFKKAFSNKEVLEAFVHDIVGVDFVAGKIETEKRFSPSVGKVDSRFDIFAESPDGRVIVELQRVYQDYHFDRFLHYHCAAIVEQPKNYKSYILGKTVYTIILLTQPYEWMGGKKVEKSSVLISNFDPRNLDDVPAKIYGHKLIFLNPNDMHKELPPEYRDWLDLVAESQKDKDEQRRTLNYARPGIRRASDLIDWDGLSEEERGAIVKANDMEKATAFRKALFKKNKQQIKGMKKEVAAANLRAEQEKQEKDAANLRAEQEKQEKDAANLRAEQEKQEKDAANLRAEQAEERMRQLEEQMKDFLKKG